jgi:hypothetical protein
MMGPVPLPISIGLLLGDPYLGDCFLNIAPLDIISLGPVLWSQQYTFQIPPIWMNQTVVFLQAMSLENGSYPETLTNGIRIEVVGG